MGDSGEDTLIGGIGNDVFVLSPNSGVDTVLNFEVGLDKFGLAGGLSFDQLQITSTLGGTVFQVANNGQVLANLLGANGVISTLDFVLV